MKFLLLLLLAATASHITAQPVTQYRQLDSIAVSARNNPLNIYRKVPDHNWDILHEDITLSFNWTERTALGFVSITVKPVAFVTDTLVLDAEDMRIEQVQLVTGNTTKESSPYRYDGKQLFIAMLHPLAEGHDTATRKITIKYLAEPYAGVTGGSAAIKEDRGLYFINMDGKIPGKPRQVWTQGETESNSHWVPCIDNPNERLTFSLTLTGIPDTMVTLSNGVLLGTYAEPRGKLKTWRWEMKQPIQTYAMMFAIGRYSIIKDAWRGKEVSYYLEPEFAQFANGMFRKTPAMIEYFSEETGVPYPWNKYSQVTARDYVSGAMENTTASLFGEFVNKDSRQLLDEDNEGVVSHELFHQWFGDYVTAESWSNLTLNESFATLGTQLWLEHEYGEDRAQQLAWEDLKRYIESTQRGTDPPLVRYYYRDKEDMFDRVSYQKGASILRYLRSLIGKDAFSRAMQLYLTNNALHAAEASDWRKAVEAATGKDWNWFFNEFYYRGGHPNLTIRYKYDDSAQQCRMTIRQRTTPDTGYAYQLPVPLSVLYPDGTVHDTMLNISELKTVFYIPYRNGQKPLPAPDADRIIPCTFDEPNKSIGQFMAQATALNNFRSWQRALDKALNNKDNDTALTVFSAALQSPVTEVQNYAASLLPDVKEQKWKTALSANVQQVLNSQHSSNAAKADALKTERRWATKNYAVVAAGFLHDSSYAIAAQALLTTNVSDSVSAYSIAKSFISQGVHGDLEDAAIEVIAGFGAPKDTSFFSSRMAHQWGKYRAGTAASLLQYAIATKDNQAFEESLKLLNAYGRQEAASGQRAPYGYYLVYVARNYRTQASKGKPGAGRRAGVAMKYAQGFINEEQDQDVQKVLSTLLNKADDKD